MSKKVYREGLQPYLPEGSVDIIAGWLEELKLRVTLWNHRKTKYGDFRMARHPGELNAVSVNKSLNPYSFLITLVHEISHAAVFENFGRTVKPHGEEWKNEYRGRLLVLLRERIFPDELEREIAAHLKNPKGSVNANPALEKLLRTYDDNPDNDLVYIDDLNQGDYFVLPSNGLTFVKGAKRRTRHHCTEKASGREFLISGMARVIPLRRNRS